MPAISFMFQGVGLSDVDLKGLFLKHADTLRGLIAAGAKIMVCGGRDMAQGVQAALADILAPLGLSPRSLKAEGRYAEDSY